MNLRIRNRVKRVKLLAQGEKRKASQAEGVGENGRLLKGYRYSGGKVVRASTWASHYS